MDAGEGGKKTSSKNPKLFKEESGPSSKRWMRSHAKKSSDKSGASTGMNSDSGEEKAEIDKGEKYAEGGAMNRKLSTSKEHETSPKRWLRSSKKPLEEIEQSETSKLNSKGVESVEIDVGKGKKRKLSTMEEEIPSKRRLTNTKRLEENLELPIFKLPMELWEKIIDMVPISQWSGLELVSHRFQEIVHGMWEQQREIRLDEFVYNKKKKPFKVVEAMLKKFLIRSANVASINGFAEFFDESAPIRRQTIQLLSKFEHLQTIDFSGGKVISSRIFAAFLESSASRQCWKRLDILGGIFGEMKSNNAVVSKENHPALKLESFKFNMETLYLFDRFLPPIEWSGLKELVIDGSFGCAKEVLLIIRQCTQVAHLEFEVPLCGEGNGQPSYAILMQAIADLENLSVLKIRVTYSGDKDFQDALLLLIQRLGRRGIITDLALMPCFFSYVFFDAIIDHLKRLKSLELDVSSCKSASLLRLANGMGQLECLKFQSYCYNSSLIDSSVIQDIGDNMSQLRCLHFGILNGVSKDFAALGNLPKLKELRFTRDFKEYGNGNLGTWASLGFGECMESLEINFQAGIRPETLVKFFKNMPRLSRLRLEGAIGRKGILKAVAKSCPRLVELHLGYTRIPFGITATQIQFVIDRCSQLKYLKLNDHHDWFPDALKVGKYRQITFKSDE